MAVRLDLDVSQHQLEWHELAARVRRAEELGFEGVWVFDHFQPLYGDPGGPCLEGWTLLAALASVTSRVRLGTLVTGVTYRSPSLLAAEAVTVDHVSGGRLELGVGAAWFEREHAELGFDFPPPAERVHRLDEALEVVRLLMTRDDVSFDGRFYRLRRASYNPKPVQRPHPPVWVGGSGRKLMLPLVARRADVWHGNGSVAELTRMSRAIDELAARAGRDPGSIRRTTSLSISEPWDEVRAHAATLADAGFSCLVVDWPTEGAERVEEFAGAVMPELAALHAG
ncbi:MAG TPA: TIGR03560 family F420-dependent LLM class oxidoreductase [Actinomycetota bacterium]|nr:TIGR03560 family F420-dependent LLM class oxidoreductase [Actinomycetota bacterium]